MIGVKVASYLCPYDTIDQKFSMMSSGIMIFTARFVILFVKQVLDVISPTLKKVVVINPSSGEVFTTLCVRNSSLCFFFVFIAQIKE